MSDSEDSSASELGEGITLDDLQQFVGGAVAVETDSDDDDDFVPASPESEESRPAAALKLPGQSSSQKATKKGKDRLSPRKSAQSKSPAYSPMKKIVKKTPTKSESKWTCKAAFDASAPWKAMGKALSVARIPDAPVTSAAFCDYCLSPEATIEEAMKRIAVIKKEGKDSTVIWGFLSVPGGKKIEMITNQPTTKRVGAMIAFIETKKQKWGPAAAKFWTSWQSRVQDMTGFPIPALLELEIKKAAKKGGQEKKADESVPSVTKAKPAIKRKAESGDDESSIQCRAAKRPAALENPSAAAAVATASAAEVVADGNDRVISFSQFAAFAERHNISAIHFK